MRSLGATGPTELSVTGKRYSSGWTHSQRLKLRAKASGYCSQRRRETGVQGQGASQTLPPTLWWGTRETPITAQSRGKGVGREEQDVRSESLPGPNALAKDTEMDPGEREMGPLLG